MAGHQRHERRRSVHFAYICMKAAIDRHTTLIAGMPQAIISRKSNDCLLRPPVDAR